MEDPVLAELELFDKGLDGLSAKEVRKRMVRIEKDLYVNGRSKNFMGRCLTTFSVSSIFISDTPTTGIGFNVSP